MVRRLTWLLLLITLGMCATSFSLYTSVGLDDEVLRDGEVIRRYWRVRWPGNGAFFVGAGQHLKPEVAAPTERWDPAALFFSSTTDPLPEWQGRLNGFRSVEQSETSAQQRWIGMPAFYPPLLLLLLLWLTRSGVRDS